MAAAAQIASEERLTGGKFYGSVLSKQAVGGAIFTELRHSQARKLPQHSHELPFFCLVFDGDYAVTRTPTDAGDLQVESLVSELLAAAWRASRSVVPSLRFGCDALRPNCMPSIGSELRSTNWQARPACIRCTFLACFVNSAEWPSANMSTGCGREACISYDLGFADQPLHPRVSKHHGKKPGCLSRHPEQQRDYFYRFSEPPPILTQWAPPSVEYSDHHSTKSALRNSLMVRNCTVLPLISFWLEYTQ